MSRFSISKRKLVAGFVLVLVVFTEWLSYLLCTLTWARLPNASVTLLLVSDPQLIGDKNEYPPPLGSIIRWDADRYLAKTFALAVHHVRPDVVVFLGDHMDEGSIASDAEFAYYIKRFYNTFSTSYNVKMVHIPGDNDIGGEGGDDVTDIKTERFKNAFQKDTHVIFKFVEFIRANYFTQKVERFSVSSMNKRILVSHFPVVPAGRKFGKQAIRTVQPDIIFSGHEHFSSHFTGNRSSGDLLNYETLDEHGHVWSFDTTTEVLHEILVPTCSYRMGRKQMAYGAATIEDDGMIHYTVLWLPGRYPQLHCYLVVLFILIAVQAIPHITMLTTAVVKMPSSPCCCFRS